MTWTEDEWRDYVTAEREGAFFSGLNQGAKAERERIIAYLTKHDILREAMFYEGFVAMNTSGTTGIDLGPSLGADE